MHSCAFIAIELTGAPKAVPGRQGSRRFLMDPPRDWVIGNKKLPFCLSSSRLRRLPRRRRRALVGQAHALFEVSLSPAAGWRHRARTHAATTPAQPSTHGWHVVGVDLVVAVVGDPHGGAIGPQSVGAAIADVDQGVETPQRCHGRPLPGRRRRSSCCACRQPRWWCRRTTSHESCRCRWPARRCPWRRRDCRQRGCRRRSCHRCRRPPTWWSRPTRCLAGCCCPPR